MDNFYPYPLTIVRDRYNGCYSGGEFTAWNLCPENIPEEIDSDDVRAAVPFSTEPESYMGVERLRITLS